MIPYLSLTTDNKMICQFCKQVCLKMDRERKRYWYWKCEKCSIVYLASLAGKLEFVKFMKSTEDKGYFVLELNLRKKVSNLHKMSPTVYGTFEQNMIKDFSHLIDINPNNFQDKLKTYLIFS